MLDRRRLLLAALMLSTVLGGTAMTAAAEDVKRGGTLTLGPGDSGGTTVHWSVPLP